MSEATAQTGLSDDAASGVAYITIIPAIIFLLVAPYNQNPKVKFHCWQSICLGVAWVAVWIVLGIVGAIPFLNLVDIILMPLVGLVFLVVWLIAMIQAFQGKRFNLPFISDLAAKQAGV